MSLRLLLNSKLPKRNRFFLHPGQLSKHDPSRRASPYPRALHLTISNPTTLHQSSFPLMNEKSPEKDSPPPSPPPKPSSTTSSPNHTRDASLQQILRQFDPLSPERQAKKEPPLPPPKDVSAPSSPDVTLPPPAVPEKENRNSFNMTRRSSILSVERPPPAEPDQPFEFQRFLDQMRHKSADAVARYMKRYISTIS